MTSSTSPSAAPAASKAHAPRGQATHSVDKKDLGFDFNKLVLHLYETVPQFIAPLRIEKFALGQSNPTYFLVDGREQKYVLRKKPAGALLSPTAHAVEREYQVLHGLGTCGQVPVPRVYTLCTDSSVIGTPFYVMEFVKGRIFPSPALPEIPSKDRRAYWEAAIRTLARLHSTDLHKAQLASYGPSSGFYQRQLKTLLKVSDAQAQVKDAKGKPVGVMPGRDMLKQWFEANMPKDEATIIHGDYKFDNLIFHPTRPEVIGILDWELSTLGHPLSDLANFLMSHYAPSQMTHSSIVGIQGRAADLGIPTLTECLDLYAQAAGRPRIAAFDFYAAFVFFKFAVITQGVKARMYRGQASSREAGEASRLFEPCAEIAGRIIREAGGKGKSKL
ncbi:kinase-like domain-containing protein [Catenaria anguillulae PL171]|uniref:Kinase-like domain-containing protein n=1 Tax=Catenaria anguillulae PL171 TaxID=765915 RepID=A0A1Y2HTX3_9FUNG|nr:kinase-like domain-containing protein [Catenaria anguillulae PL171]